MQVKVICRTPRCVSESAVTLLTDPEGLVICGYCSVEITEKVEVGPALTEPVVIETVADQLEVTDQETVANQETVIDTETIV